MMQQIVNLPQPVIAAVQGVATAAGCQLVASCDLAVASTRGASSPRPASISACSARRRWWRCRAMWRASTPWKCCSPATWSRPRRPLRIGLVNRVVAAGQERDAALALARTDRRQIGLYGQDRQAGLLPPDSKWARRGLSLRLRSDGGEHDGARRRGRHRRLHRKARADLGRPLMAGLANRMNHDHLSRQLYPRHPQHGEDHRHGRRLAEGHAAELFRVQISARARLPRDPGQSRPGRQGNPRAEQSTPSSPTSPSRSTWSTSSAPPQHVPADRRRGAGARAAAASDLDAAHRAQRRGRRARRGRRHQGGDEPLPQDRIWPAVVGDFLDRRQFAHAVVEDARRCSAKACSAWGSARHVKAAPRAATRRRRKTATLPAKRNEFSWRRHRIVDSFRLTAVIMSP